MYFAEAYLAFIALFYLIGPWSWKTHDPALFWTLIILFQLAFGLGYWLRAGKTKIEPDLQENREKHEKKIMAFLRFAVPLNVILQFLLLLRFSGSAFSAGALWNGLMASIDNPVDQYQTLRDANLLWGGRLLSRLSTLCAPVIWASFPLAFCYFGRLKFVYKLLTILMTLLYVASWLFRGQNKGVFDLLFIGISVFLLNVGWSKWKNGKITWKMRSAIGGLIVFGGILICYFTNNINLRLKGYTSSLENILQTDINYDSLIMRWVPEAWQNGVIFLGSYLTQGYYAFSMVPSVDWIPMWGCGNSYFLLSNLESLFNTDLFQYSYQTGLEQEFGWPAMLLWHSMYTWWANDVHYIGVIVIMFLFGYLFAYTWIESLCSKNPFTIVLFSLLLIAIVYIPGNNQVLSHPSTGMTFYVVFLLLLFTRLNERNSHE